MSHDIGKGNSLNVKIPLLFFHLLANIMRHKFISSTFAAWDCLIGFRVKVNTDYYRKMDNLSNILCAQKS